MPSSESVTLTRPTERRDGEEIEPTAIRCHACGAEGVVRRDVARCGNCSAWCETAEGGEER